MRWFAIASVTLALLAGCSGTRSAGTAAVPAAAPHEIKELTNQTTIYTCPECQMEYDHAGQCSMCKVDLVETRVAYICPADGRPVEHSGKCPRCETNAKIVKTAMTQGTPAPANGN